MDVGTMDHRVRIAEALAERVADRQARDLGRVDRVHQHHPLGVDGTRPGAVADPERVECGERVRTELDAGADLADRRRLFEHLDRTALARERERRGKTADAAAGDQHGVRFRLHRLRSFRFMRHAGRRRLWWASDAAYLALLVTPAEAGAKVRAVVMQHLVPGLRRDDKVKSVHTRQP